MVGLGKFILRLILSSSLGKGRGWKGKVEKENAERGWKLVGIWFGGVE